ncbi:MAG: transcriptional regulator [Rhodanobacter sp.]|nr:MAG: transcriptional regulator [Rhodanobacter sp.]TAM38330.1 MAG: transcriptional regulator [Rhodanobacter sp.]TAN29082.1 MAG: transcriptional regulator [Rhodanobacter sp.]
MRLSDEELEALLSDIESDRAERKESAKGDAPEKLRQAICAFANDLPGHSRPGVAFVGAKDDGSAAGLVVTDELLRTLADMRSDGNIQPMPTMSVEKRNLHGFDLAVITVLPADAPPVRYKGRTYVRTGPRRGIASAQDERVLNERRRHRDLPFDLQPVSFATLADLNRSVFENEYLPGAFSADTLEANHRSYAERLSACRMIDAVDSAIPTVLGSLVIGNRPRDLIPCAYLQFLRIDGTALEDPIIDEAAIDGRLEEVLARIDDKLKAHISVGVNIDAADTERRQADYPLVALQQLVRNAVMHRSYEATNAPIRLTWFDDRIEIVNPGGPFGIVTAANFGMPGMTDYRNPHLAEAMKVLGYVQRFGVGIATARRLLAANGNPEPDFHPSDTHVLVIVRRAA